MARRSSGSARDGSRGRRTKRLPRPRRILVVTNGKETETQYCDFLNEAERAKPREQQGFYITYKSNPIDPAKLAKYALGLVRKDRNASEKKHGGTSDPYDLIFVVVDVDDYLRDNPKNLREAQDTCNQGGMRLVISNPCFEVWLIDHVTVCPRTSRRKRKPIHSPSRRGSRRAGTTSTSFPIGFADALARRERRDGGRLRCAEPLGRCVTRRPAPLF